MFDLLFSPITIRELSLPNRVVMTAMCTYLVDGNSVTQPLIDYARARALGGCGLIFMECTSVVADASPKNHPSLASDSFVAGHAEYTRAIHEAGGKCAVQLWAPGAGAMGDPSCRIYLPDGYDSSSKNIFIAPAARRDEGDRIFPITKSELERTANDFGKATARAVAAGYDMIEFHCGHNYLPHTMLSKAFNHRNDEYGGSLKNRMRFPLECIRAIRANMPQGMPLSMRISVVDEDDLDGGKGGNSIEENIEFCKAAKLAGVDVVNVSRGNFTGIGNVYEVPPVNIAPGFNVDNAARIRRETGLVTMAVGRINRPELAESVLEEGKADLVAMSRAHMADPEFCNKARTGRTDEIRYCIGCNQGCSDASHAGERHTCLRNPFLGLESAMRVEKAETPKTVLVIGGGMAGMECALFLKQRGHRPVLVEKSDRLGGQFILAGKAPQKAEFVQATRDEANFVRAANIELRLNTPATPSLIEEMRPDEVVIATGAGPLLLPIPGAELPQVSNAHQVLSGERSPGGRVAIIGGGIVGVEVAEYLLSLGQECAIIEMKGEIASDLGVYRKILSKRELEENKVQCIVNAACTEITEQAVRYTKDGGTYELPCDSVVIAAGAKPLPTDSLREMCEKLNIPYHVIGDAVAARRALNAVAEGVQTALKI